MARVDGGLPGFEAINAATGKSRISQEASSARAEIKATTVDTTMDTTMGRRARMHRLARTSALAAIPFGPPATTETAAGDRRHSGTTTSAGTLSTIEEGSSAPGEFLAPRIVTTTAA
jgi:hypothetical protein